MEAAPEPPRFRGLNNRIDPTALGSRWLTVADYAACDDAGVLVSAPGFRTVQTGIKDAYATYDGRLFVVDAAGALAEMDASGAKRPVGTVVGAPFAWAEQGNTLYLMSEAGAWTVYPSGAVKWGYFCPSVAAQDYPGAPRRAYPPPRSKGPVAPWLLSMLVAVHEPAQDRTVLYKSRSGLPHEFYLDTDYTLIPGQVRLLASTARGLVIGTDRAVYLDTFDEPLVRATTYGVPVGASVHHDADEVFFWTDRGLCSAFPFQNLTDAAWIAPRHARVATGLLRWKGSEYAAVALSGPVAQDSPNRPFTPAVPVLATHPPSL